MEDIADFSARIRLLKIPRKRRYRSIVTLQPLTGRGQPPDNRVLDHEGVGAGACPAVAIRRAVDDALHDINRWRRERGLKVLG